MSMKDFRELTEGERSRYDPPPEAWKPCGHWITVSRATSPARPRYTQCIDCGQVRLRFGMEPLIHNGKKRRKA